MGTTFKIGSISLSGSTIITYIAVIYVMLMSGTVLHVMNMIAFQRINILVAIAGVVFFVLLKLRKRQRLTLPVGFLILSSVSVIVIPVLWGEVSSITSYIANFCLLLTPWLITEFIDFEKFKTAYLKIIFVIAVISIILFLFPQILKIIPSQTLVNPNGMWEYDFYWIYAKYVESSYSILQRNIGIFWEPGMYQGFLIFAMILVALDKKITKKKHIIYQLVILVCVLTTASTAGYILLFAVAAVYILKLVSKLHNIYQFSIMFIFTGVILLAFFIPDIIIGILKVLPQDVFGKILEENLSRDTRLYGTIADFILVIKNPLGVGQLSINTLRANMLNSLNAVTDTANVNTTFTMMLYHGIVPGVLYFAMCVKSCFALTSNKFIGIVILIVMVITINTEPHYLTLFFTTIFFYLSKYKITKANSIKYERT